MINATSLDRLNAVRQIVVSFANANGINLSEQFADREAFTQFVFALAIRTLVDRAGFSLEQAYDHLMGDGAFRAMSDDVWAANQLAA